MRVKVYRYSAPVTRSILRASCVTEIDAADHPGCLAECLENQEGFARQHGGNFIEFDDTDES